MKKRVGENLKYWKGSATSKHKHHYDIGMSNKPSPDHKLSFDEELSLFLVKLKSGMTNIELKVKFGVSDTSVGQIFTTHINLLCLELKISFEVPS